jgi:hypothetical protein
MTTILGLIVNIIGKKKRDSKRHFGGELVSTLVAVARNPQQGQRRGKTQERGISEETNGEDRK